MLSRAATMPCAQLSLCHSARSVCDQLYIVAQAFAALLAQQLELLARVHRSTAAALGYCTPCHCDFSHSALVLSLFRFSFSRLAPEFPVADLTGELVVCFDARSTHTSKGNERTLKKPPRSPFAPRRAQGTCALQPSDHRSAASNAPLAELLRSRREQLRQNPEFAIGQNARHRE